METSPEFPGYACLLGNTLDTANVVLSQPECSLDMVGSLCSRFIVFGCVCVSYCGWYLSACLLNFFLFSTVNFTLRCSCIVDL